MRPCVEFGGLGDWRHAVEDRHAEVLARHPGRDGMRVATGLVMLPGASAVLQLSSPLVSVVL
jgi:hypothetical protein